MTYQVVTGSPMGSVQPLLVCVASMGLPIGAPDPSSAVAVTLLTPSRLRRVIVPLTGSIREGDAPWSRTRVCSGFHFIPVLATREPAVSSILSARAIGLVSIDVRTRAAKLLLIPAARFRVALPLAVINPI